MRSLNKYIFLLVSLIITPHSYAQSVLTCLPMKVTTIDWKDAGLFTKAGLKAEADNSPNASALSFVINSNSAILKGNGGQVELKKISQDIFLEVTLSGNVFLWSLIRGQGSIPDILFQQKAYKMIDIPFSITVAYVCN